mmetsp:Transcript_67820/g.201817  ORF Transcript_67820/g.201817 Transcript_67820/m.201817 type:complete len:292 (+) Transcript_67820:63-938(+)
MGIGASVRRSAVAPAPSPICVRPGCGKPTWNGNPNEYCGRTCKNEGDGSTPDPGSPVGQSRSTGSSHSCVKAGCGKPTWNGQPNEYCSNFCRTTDGQGSKTQQVFGQQVDQQKFDEIVKQFNDKWKSGNTPPTIKSVWFVQDADLLKKHEAYCNSIGDVPVKGFGRNPGNQQRRFHATKLGCSFNGTPCSNSSACYVCSIIRTGFKTSRAGSSAGTRFGAGVYCSSTSSKAYSYGKQAMFVVGVACGVADVSGSSGSLPAGTHSRIVNNSDDECVVFDDAAMVPKYLILFQ